MNYSNQRSRQHYGRDRQRPPIKFEEQFNPVWIKTGADKQMIAFCEKAGKFLQQHKISSSQLRNIYGEINRIKLKGLDKEKTAFYLLKPKIAYNVVRVDNRDVKEAFKSFMEKALIPAIDAVEIEKFETFDNFQKFFEAIIAYHKYFGGK